MIREASSDPWICLLAREIVLNAQHENTEHRKPHRHPNTRQRTPGNDYAANQHAQLTCTNPPTSVSGPVCKAKLSQTISTPTIVENIYGTHNALTSHVGTCSLLPGTNRGNTGRRNVRDIVSCTHDKGMFISTHNDKSTSRSAMQATHAVCTDLGMHDLCSFAQQAQEVLSQMIRAPRAHRISPGNLDRACAFVGRSLMCIPGI